MYNQEEHDILDGIEVATFEDEAKDFNPEIQEPDYQDLWMEALEREKLLLEKVMAQHKEIALLKAIFGVTK